MENQIKCPECGTVFPIDETQYQDILNQVRNDAFDKQVADIKASLLQEKNKDIELEKEKAKKDLVEALAAKDKELATLKADLENKDTIAKQEANKLVADKEKELQAQLASKAEELAKLKTELESKDTIAKQEADKLVADKEKELTEDLNTKETELAKLKADLENKDKLIKQELDTLAAKKDLEKTNAINEIESLKKDLENKLERKETEFLNQKQAIEIKNKEKTDELNAEIDRLKDNKLRLSTKMLGETLELHCENSFKQFVRPFLPNAEFGKDNTVIEGGKGDYVYREYDDNGVEILSIMFEMKNEAEDTKSKQKNEEFYKKLDADRRKKNCEYAVLVSLLEIDNDLFNNGIYDVSYEYPKMYVIRPQLFIPIIGLLRNAAMSTLKYKQEVELIKSQQIDVTNFEKKMIDFKVGFDKNAKDFNAQLDNVEKNIDNAIASLTKTLENFRLARTHLGRATNKLDDLTIKKLTKGNPTMTILFEESENSVENNIPQDIIDTDDQLD